MPPIIVTLAIDGESQGLLDDLRRRHFPPERNHIDTHVTLFHALDGARALEILTEIEALEVQPFPILGKSLRSLGRGVAIEIASERLLAVRARLAALWTTMLTPQDRQKYQPHVTVQNKVAPSEARALLAAWQPTFSPFTIQAVGLSVWHYLGGPWDLVRTVPFGAAGGGGGGSSSESRIDGPLARG